MFSYICSYVDVIKSSTQTEQSEDVNTQEDMYNTEKFWNFNKDKIAKKVGCNQEEKTTGNTMYQKIQSPYRTRKKLPYKAPHILPIESWRWHNIDIPKLPRFIHQQTVYHTSICTKI